MLFSPIGIIAGRNFGALQTINPSNKSAGMTLSNGNLTVSASTTGSLIVGASALVGKPTGKYYWEASIDSVSGQFPSIEFGVSTATDFDKDVNNWGSFNYQSGVGGLVGSEPTIAAGANGSFAFPVSIPLSVGSIWCLAADFGNGGVGNVGKLWVRKDNGSWYGYDSVGGGVAVGNPVAGTNGINFSFGTMPWIPVVQILVSSFNAAVCAVTATFRFRSSQLSYTPPAGFSSKW